MRGYYVSTAIGLALIAGSAMASETITYSYDAKGRLIRVVHSGTVNSGVVSTYSHDHTDNRTSLSVSGVASTPTPTPNPTPTNASPTAQDDVLNMGCTQSAVIAPLANDTDSDGDYPLSITTLNYVRGLKYTVVLNPDQTLTISRKMPLTLLNLDIQYRVVDARGGESNFAHVTIAGKGSCS